MTGRTSERGAALLTVLLLVAVMATVSALTLERLTLAARLNGSAAALDQARLYTLAAEQLAVRRIAGLAQQERTTLGGGWQGRRFTVPLPQGTGAIRVSDGGNCFNLNSLVTDPQTGNSAARPLAQAQFTQLMTTLGIDAAQTDRIVAATTDWIDTDSLAQVNGEDSDLSPNRPMSDASELAAVPGMTGALWQRLRPWVCALPSNDLSPININTLLPEQAPLLIMLTGDRLSLSAARDLLASRPADGFASALAFWNSGALATLRPPTDAAAQVQVKTRWFRLLSDVTISDTALNARSLIDAGGPVPRVVRRAWIESE
jgi:general secretion pathway protein K